MFKVGQKVKVINKDSSFYGYSGTIASYDEDMNRTYPIIIINSDSGYPYSSGIAFAPEELELLSVVEKSKFNIGDKLQAKINKNNIIEIVRVSSGNQRQIFECTQTISGRIQEEYLLLTLKELETYWEPMKAKEKTYKFKVGDICQMQMLVQGRLVETVVSISKLIERDSEFQYSVEPGDIYLRIGGLFTIRQTKLFEAKESELTLLSPVGVISQTQISDTLMLFVLDGNKYCILNFDGFLGSEKENINMNGPETSDLN